MFEAMAGADGDPILADMAEQVEKVYRCGKRPKCRWYGVMEDKGWLYGSMGLHWCTTSTTNHRLLRTFIQKGTRAWNFVSDKACLD